MKRWFYGLVGTAALGVAMLPAGASIVPTLQTVTTTSGISTFSYDAVLTFDQGLSKSVINTESGQFVGSRFVIFDFVGYVPGSIVSSNALFTPSVENVSTGLAVPPGATDSASLVNLVFTYNGPDFRTTGGSGVSGSPYADLDLGTFSAQSIYAQTGLSFAASVGVKNFVTPYPGGTANTASYSTNSVLVPQSPVPEAATWAMMVIGFGGMGATLRVSRRRVTVGFAG